VFCRSVPLANYSQTQKNTKTLLSEEQEDVSPVQSKANFRELRETSVGDKGPKMDGDGLLAWVKE